MKDEMLFAVFPQVDMGNVSYGNMRLAGRKAITAQTFKARESDIPFLESKYWAEYDHLFSVQYNLLSPPPRLFFDEMGQWVAYPYSVRSDYPEQACVVWVETTPRRPYIRHVRLYNDRAQATADNCIIQAVFENRGD